MNKKTKKAVRLLKAMKKRVTKKTLLASRKKDAFDILIATILSQRTRDENTRKAANSLLSKYPSAKKLANAPLKEIEKLIKPAGFYKEKAKRIKQVSKIIAEKYTGKVPKNLKALLELPGVGRKTA
ncbi:MAG: endonuclease III domain-containing protein, partial [Candidatus Micrarchaeia archaeon]